MGRHLSRFKVRQLWWRKTTRNHTERLKKIGKWHGLPRLTLSEWTKRWEEIDHRCGYCFKQFEDIRDVWIEHLVGIQDGGFHRIENCIPACPKCNQQKGTKTLQEYNGQDPQTYIAFALEKIAHCKKQEKEEVKDGIGLSTPSGA